MAAGVRAVAAVLGFRVAAAAVAELVFLAAVSDFPAAAVGRAGDIRAAGTTADAND